MTHQPLVLRKHADDDGGLAGISFAGPAIDPPYETKITPRKVREGIRDGWLSVEGEQIVHRPGGPPDDVWRVTHTFRHYTALVFHTLDGDVRYRVVHQPDKYADRAEATRPDAVEPFAGDDDTPVTAEMYAAGATRVDHYYTLQREDS